MRLGKNIDNGNGYLLNLKYANRHGFVTGATGTGKTYTLATMVEGFLKNGVDVFCADVKGDLDALGQGVAGSVVHWDIHHSGGSIPASVSVSSFGPLLMSSVLKLSPVQSGVLSSTFMYASDKNMRLVTLNDLILALNALLDEGKDAYLRYGNVTSGTVGAVVRAINALKMIGGTDLFQGPTMDVKDLFSSGLEPSRLNVFVADKLSEDMYAIFLLWMLREIWNFLPEQGDSDKPKMVFFFDEAHLLFGRSAELTKEVERIVRLIRSKGVGIYFVTQAPSDIPDTILRQLSNRVQHALRAYTSKELTAIKAAAATFRPSPYIKSKLTDVITALPVGQAVVSTIEDRGAVGDAHIVQIDIPEMKQGGRCRTTSPDLYWKYERKLVDDELSMPEKRPSGPNMYVVSILCVLAVLGMSPFLGFTYAVFKIIAMLN